MTKLSLICSIAGVALIYEGALHMRANLTPISKIDESFVGLKTKLSGKIINTTEHPDNHIFLNIQDESKEVISAPIFSKIRNKLKDSIEIGDKIQISGKIKKYGGELEIIPQNQNSIKIISKPPIRASNIDREMVGEIIKVRGIFVKKYDSENFSFILRDGKSSILVNLVDQYKKPNLDLQRGDVLEVIGTIKSEKNMLRIQVESKNVHSIED